MKDLHIDPDTDQAALSTFSLRTGKIFDLVVSDEYSESGRSFRTGDDLIFEAIDHPDFTNNAMQFYNSSYVTTKDGFLVITTTAEKTSWREVDKQTNTTKVGTRNYTSGMVQSWNKLCFTGGILEVSVQLPGGRADAGGLWPAAWLMGNLGRAIFPESTLAMWPWSYDKCGAIEDLEWKQEISACDPSPGHGLHPHQGRGAPEIDLFEVMLGHSMPGESHVPAFMSSSLQIAPGIDKNKRPKNGCKLRDVTPKIGCETNYTVVWYEGIQYSNESEFNYGFWGQLCGPEFDDTANHKRKYLQDALSVNTNLKETHFRRPHKYRLEWEPDPQNGYLTWYLDDDMILSIEADVLNMTGASIPSEPMYMIFNTAVSHSWGFPEPCDVENCDACYHCYDCTSPYCQCTLPEGMRNCDNLPAEMKIDYIRLYQNDQAEDHTLSCSPPRFPTAGFIANFPERYSNWNSTQKALAPEELSRDITFVLYVLVFLLLCVIISSKSWMSFFSKKLQNGSINVRDALSTTCYTEGSGHRKKNETLPLLPNY